MRLRDNLWLLMSQSVNVCLGGDPDESLSARAARENRKNWMERIDSVLGWGHCEAVYKQQQQRAINRALMRK